MSEDCSHLKWKFVCTTCGADMPKEMIEEWNRAAAGDITRILLNFLEAKR